MKKKSHLLGQFFICIGVVVSAWLVAAMLSLLPFPLMKYGDSVGVRILATLSVFSWCAAAVCYRDDMDD